MASCHIKFLVALIVMQAMTSSSQQIKSKKTTRLARMPLYYGKRSRPFPEWSHYGTNDLDIILRPTLYSSKIFPSSRREDFPATYGEYLPEMKGLSRDRDLLSPPIPGDLTIETALPYNNRHTFSDSGRQSREKIHFHVNDKKDELNFKPRSFPTRPPYEGDTNNARLKPAIWYDLKDGPEPQETGEMKMISKLLGDEMFEYPLFISPDAHKLSDGGAPEPAGQTAIVLSNGRSGLRHLPRRSRTLKSDWMRLALLLKETKALSNREPSIFDRFEDVSDNGIYVGHKRGVVHLGREVVFGDREKLKHITVGPTKRQHTTVLDRMPKYFGKRGTQSRPQTLEMLYPMPRQTILTPNIRSSKKRTNGCHRHISSPIFPDFDSLTKHVHNHAIQQRHNEMTVGDGVSKSKTPPVRGPMSKNKRIPEGAEELYSRAEALYSPAEALYSQE